MEIIVEGHKIDTKDIWKIEEAGFRMHGFIIRITGESPDIHIVQKQKYDMTPSDCAEINERYRKLRKAVEEKWEQDKNDLPVFKL